MPSRQRSYSKLTREALRLLGQRIKLARKERRMSEMDLAERIGVARSTLQKIENGDPIVDIGLVFEAAVLTGVPLFAPAATSLAPHLRAVQDRLVLMPACIRKPQGPVKNDF